jgi:hypothetical protein
MEDWLQAAIWREEERRIAALLAGDREKLSELLAETLVHIHASGKVETKPEYLDTAIGRLDFISIVRPDFQVRAIGDDCALSFGRMIQELRPKGAAKVTTMDAIVSQLWCQTRGQWTIAWFQATKIA